jgi:hypothetical protein
VPWQSTLQLLRFLQLTLLGLATVPATETEQSLTSWHWTLQPAPQPMLHCRELLQVKLQSVPQEALQKSTLLHCGTQPASGQE